jgi:hypothetical protein
MKAEKINRVIKGYFLILYLFTLAVITFHHHPFNLNNTPPYYKNIPATTAPHHFTADECPIINFSNTGFNSFGILVYNYELNLENIFSILPDVIRFSSRLFINFVFLRAPPING